MNQTELRAMVRDVLREAFPIKGNVAATIESIRLGSDADLADFVRRVIERQDVIKAGQLRFTLASTPLATAQGSGGVLTGVITEHVIDRHASAGLLVLAADAVMTPLARDRARKLKLKIERRR